jgi:hypothetical protein
LKKEVDFMDEREYLENVLLEVSYAPERFNIQWGDDKYIFGIFSGTEACLKGGGKIFQYKTLYDTLKDIDKKIKLSFQEAIKYAYSSPVTQNFQMMVSEPTSDEEFLSYYFIENALFRLSTLWDLLAQFYNIYYQLNIPKEKVYYNRMFNPESPQSVAFKSKATEINAYFQEKDSFDEGEWRGNHDFAKALRNKMTHRNSPSLSVMSDFDINIKNHPIVLNYRLIEDYKFVSKELREILDIVDIDIQSLN